MSAPPPFIESQIVEGYFKKNQQGDYNSVTISGKVQSEEKNEVLPGADVTLGNDVTGEVYATTHTGADGSYVLITCKPVGQDGYSFDYIELNGTKYYVGDSFEFQEGVKGLTAVVHYTNGTGEGQIAQTGDAIPFVAIVGLGIVAVVAFVVARKKFN